MTGTDMPKREIVADVTYAHDFSPLVAIFDSLVGGQRFTLQFSAREVTNTALYGS